MRNRILAFVLFTVSCVTPALASAVEFDEQTRNRPIRWPTKTVRLALSSSAFGEVPNIKYGTDVASALVRSFRSWEPVTGVRFELVRSDELNASPKGTAGNGVSLVTLAPTTENLLLFGKNVLEVPAATRIFFDRFGNITEADIVLNPIHQFSDDGTFGTFDLEAVFTHEIGHLLGIDHSLFPGSVMFSTLARNGLFGLSLPAPRELSSVDKALARQIYGSAAAEDNCCSKIVGRITHDKLRKVDGGSVFAESVATGEIVGAGRVETDGTFEIGGLLPGELRLIWTADQKHRGRTFADPGTIELGESKIHRAEFRVALNGRGPSIEYAGLNGEFARPAIPMTSGRTHTVYVAGRDLDPENVSFGFSSSLISVVPGSIEVHEPIGPLAVVSFGAFVEPDARPGSYSIFAINDLGRISYLPGAVLIDPNGVRKAEDRTTRD